MVLLPSSRPHHWLKSFNGGLKRLTSYFHNTYNKINRINKIYKEVLDCQSEFATIGNAGANVVSETVSFTDQNPSYSYSVDSSPDATYNVADATDVSLANFLSRPVLIQSFNWATAAPNLYERFNPWRNFLSEPRIANRIAHYSYLRCKLKIRVLVNGNAFHYGRAILSYIPLAAYDDLTRDRAWVQQDIIQASQRPHIYIDPTYSQGGEMTLPFFFFKNMVSIPDNEYDALGELVLHTINVLKHANGATDNVTVNVFAWAEDVALAGPTAATSVDLTPQADEYGQGPISKPASIVARVAKQMKSLPMIRPYARATEIAATAVSDCASMFGYCRPNDISTISSYKPTGLGNMANINTEDTATKLALDAKQELTLDSRTVGLDGADELSIKSIAQRESFLTSFSWPTASQRDDKLFACGVTPSLFDKNGEEIHSTALAFAADPFRYWRGTIKYRFQIVASNFHRGRIRIVYDPYATDLSTEYTEAYSRIVDLAKEKDFTVEIGWNSATSYKGVRAMRTSTPHFGPTYTIPTADRSIMNGMIGVFVVNDLTVPNSTIDNDVSVNVFVSAGDNFELAGPDGTHINRYTYFPYSALDVQSEINDMESTSNPSAPLGETDMTIGSMKISDVDQTNHVFFGESVMSFRPLLKRYNYHHRMGSPSGTVGFWTWSFPAFPFSRGYPLSAIQSFDTNYCSMTLMNYLSPAFVGWRGGIRHKVTYTAPNAVTANSNISKYLSLIGAIRDFRNGPLDFSNDFTAVNDTDEETILLENTLLTDSWSGGSFNHASLNPNVEVEVPFYSNLRFLPSKTDSAASVPSPSIDSVTLPTLKTIALTNKGQSDTVILSDFVATGEDFNLFFFTGAPILYALNSVTPPPRRVPNPVTMSRTTNNVEI